MRNCALPCLITGGWPQKTRWSNTSTLNMCVVLLFLLRIVIRHWTPCLRDRISRCWMPWSWSTERSGFRKRGHRDRQLVDPWAPRKTYGKRVETPKTVGAANPRASGVDLWGQIWLRGRSDHSFFLGSDRLELPSLPNHGFVKIYYPIGNYHHYYIVFFWQIVPSLPSNLPKVSVNPVLTHDIKHEKIIDRNADSNIKDWHIDHQQRYKMIYKMI